MALSTEFIPVKSDSQIFQMAYEEWVGVLAQLWTCIGKPVEADRLRIYCDQLKKLPLGLLEASIAKLMMENTWLTVPPVGAIWQAVRHELRDPYDLEIALEAWQPQITHRQ